jgi:hypothetical protein
MMTEDAQVILQGAGWIVALGIFIRLVFANREQHSQAYIDGHAKAAAEKDRDIDGIRASFEKRIDEV